jgi:hypothetical protein
MMLVVAALSVVELVEYNRRKGIHVEGSPPGEISSE